MEPVNHNQRAKATVRALARVRAGERPTHAARAEGINPSTLFRALAKERLPRFFLLIAPENGGLNAWVEDQRYRQQGKDQQFATITELQAVLPQLLAKVALLQRQGLGKV